MGSPMVSLTVSKASSRPRLPKVPGWSKGREHQGRRMREAKVWRRKKNLHSDGNRQRLVMVALGSQSLQRGVEGQGLEETSWDFFPGRGIRFT